MSQRKARQARQEQRGSQPPRKRRDLRRWWIVIGGSVVAALVVAGVLLARSNGPGAARPVAQVSSSNVVSLRGTDPVSGRNVDIATYAGRPVVINIWASWCPGCNQEAADLERFAQRHPEAQLVGVDIQDNSSAAKAFYQRWGWHHPSVNDPDERIASRLGLQGLPTTIFLDARHRIVTRIVGASNLSGFEQGLRLAKHA